MILFIMSIKYTVKSMFMYRYAKKKKMDNRKRRIRERRNHRRATVCNQNAIASAVITSSVTSAPGCTTCARTQNLRPARATTLARTTTNPGNVVGCLYRTSSWAVNSFPRGVAGSGSPEGEAEEEAEEEAEVKDGGE